MKTENRTFIISGGASGLGKACVVDLLKHGANVSVLDVSQDAGTQLTVELGNAVKFFHCDVLQSHSIASAVKESARWAQETGKPLGGAISAAGIAMPATVLDRHGSAFDMDMFDAVININLRGTADLVRLVAQQMAATVKPDDDGERGVVILVSSSAAYDGQKGQVSYAASKGAVASMALPIARDLARYGIRCMAIAPSLFDTAMTSAMSDKVRKSLEATFEFPKRPGRAAEFAQLARQVIENSMINGTVIRLDGASRPSKI
ncbi:hypothetical protein CDD82_5876 [Ophiocordyceps australis]|uniref:3-hydroxyacyl-CoA dehydrogenase type-2 n=1 Tax=Ophiocordyceps australis TaxID=1399860 RepID=A0A2C5Z010_9HYPO|nr:hypothetical protein CDD82_5876 [Ophiocordyceps australis]